jgi:hypothetical protein
MTSKEALAKIAKVLGLTSDKFYEGKTEQGMAIKMEGELEIGAPVYVATEEGMIPAPPGMHMLEDGTEIEVDEEGKVSKIKVGDMETEVEIEKEDSVEEEMSVEMEFGDIKLKDGSVLRLEGEEPSVGLLIKKVGYDGSLSAVSDGNYETADGKVITITGGAIEGVQSMADDKKRGEGFADNQETFTIAETAQGVRVESKTFDVGEEVMVLGEDGSKKPAPDGEHQVVLKDSSGNENKIRFITKDGKITERENVEEMETMMEIATMFSQAIKNYEVKLESLTAKIEKLEEKFHKFSMEPAGSKIYTQKTINENKNPLNTKYEGFKKLREALIQNQN